MPDFDRTIDITEAGADPNGNQPIDDVFHDLRETGTKIEFPDGRYRVADSLRLSGGNLSRFGMVATGDARLVPDPGEGRIIEGMVGTDVLIEGFVMDASDNSIKDPADPGNYRNPRIAISADDGLVLRDIEYDGYLPTGNVICGVKCNTPNGTVRVENYRLTDGTRGVGLQFGSDGGTMIAKDCDIRNCSNNGLYASFSEGPVVVRGGYYLNNNVAGVRVGQPNSLIEGVTIECKRRVLPVPESDYPINQRGIRVNNGHGPVTVRNCDIRMIGGEGFGGIRVNSNGGNIKLFNTSIHIGPDYTRQESNTTGRAINVYADTQIDNPGPNRFENVTVTGRGVGGEAARIGRGDTTFSNCCIQQGGRNRNGIKFESGENRVEQSNINVPGTPIVEAGGSVITENVAFTGQCATPDDGNGDSSQGGGLGALVLGGALGLVAAPDGQEFFEGL